MTFSLSLSQVLEKHEPHDSAHRQGYVQLPIICGGPRYFSYVERTYFNQVRIYATVEGLEGGSRWNWSIAGKPVPLIGPNQVPAEWVPQPASNPLFPDFYLRPATASVWGVQHGSPLMIIEVGPHEGNTRFIVELEVTTDPPSDSKTASLEIDLTNQEIVWEDAYHNAMRQCDRMEHLVDSLSVVLGSPQPGDPQDLISTVSNALREHGSNRAASLKNAANLLKSSRPEVAHALISLAERASDQASAHRTDHPKDALAPAR